VFRHHAPLTPLVHQVKIGRRPVRAQRDDPRARLPAGSPHRPSGARLCARRHGPAPPSTTRAFC